MKSRLLYVYIAAMLCMVGTSVEAQVKKNVGQSDSKSIEGLTLTNGEKISFGSTQSVFAQSVDLNKDLSKQKIKANFFSSNLRTVNTRATQGVPYVETFDNTDESGKPFSLESLGWTVISGGKDEDFHVGYGTSGAEHVQTPGHSGSYYIIAGYDSNNPRNEWAITPGIFLNAGTTYRIAIWGQVPGYNAKDEFTITVGAQATAAAQSTVLIDKSGDNAVSVNEWTEFAADYTPSASGVYYFGLHLCTSVPDVNLVSFDDFSVKDPSTVLAPKADFSIRTLEGGSKTTYGGVVEFTDKSTNDPTNWNWYPWGVTQQSSVHSNVSYAIYTPNTETVYDLALVASNAAGSDSICKKNALTVSEKAYSNYPYVQKTFSTEPLQALAWSGSGWNTNKSYKVTVTKGAQLFSKWFYLDADKEYRVTSQLAVLDNAKVALVLVNLDAEGKLTIAKSLEMYNVENGTGSFENQTKRFTAPVTGNYRLGYLVTELSEEALVGLQTFSLEEVTPSSTYAGIIPVLNATLNDQNSADLSYFVSGTPEVAAYTNGKHANSVSTGAAAEFGGGIILPQAMLQPYIGNQIRGIQIYIGDKNDLNPSEDVYGVIDCETDPDIYHIASISYDKVKDGWNMVDLSDDPYTITGDKDIRVSSRLTEIAAARIVPYDSDIANVVVGQTDLLLFNGEYISCNEALGASQSEPQVGHNMIKALVGDENTDLSALIPDGYNIYRNGSLLASSVTKKSYTDANLTDGAYKYVVKALFDMDAESSPSAEATVTVGTTAVLDVDADQVSVYVGVDKTLTVEGAEGKVIAIYSTDGKLVSSESNVGKMYSVALTNGIYLVKINNKTIKAIIQ